MVLVLIFMFLVIFAGSLMDAKLRDMADKRNKELKDTLKENASDFIVEDKKKEDFVVEDVKKFCPPHKWRYQEVRDPQGNTVRWRIICDLCGPLKPQNGPARVS